MCDECNDLDRRILHYRTFLKQRFDVLTEERIQELIADLEQEKTAKHASK